MKKLLQRSLAVALALLLLGGIGWEAARALPLQPDPKWSLGTEPSDALAAGGRRVRAEDDRAYYIDDADGSVYCLDNPWVPVVKGPAAGLNYHNGVLYFARPHEEDFDLCAFDVASGEERCLYRGFAGKPGQLYLVNGRWLDFSCDDCVWRCELATGSCRRQFVAKGLFSFIPTAYGLVYATGSVFHCDLYAGLHLLAEDVESYTLRTDLGRSCLVYTRAGRDYQLELAEAFAGHVEAQEFQGLDIEQDEQSGSDWSWGDWDEPSEPKDLADRPLRPTVFAERGALRAPASGGVLNIVRRSRQMLNVRWTPVSGQFELNPDDPEDTRMGTGGWGYYDSSYELYQQLCYVSGQTYIGLPYGQGMSYVPWNCSLSSFVNAINDPNSKFYTERGSYGRGSQYYGTDCSGFVSWAWDTDKRLVCSGLRSGTYSKLIGRSYTLLELGDAMVSSGHARVVTDITYNPDGSIASLEVSEANPTAGYNGCCYSTTYTGTAALERKNRDWFVNGGYSIYRCLKRDAVSYTHSCAVPLAGDVCPLCGCGAGGAQMAAEGVDVSEFQGSIDWAKVSASTDFAIIRIGRTGNTQGGIYKDSTAEQNILGCIANDIPYGLYYYAGATTPEKAMMEADSVAGWLIEGNFQPDLPIFYDVEETRNILSSAVSNSQREAIVSAFCSYLEDCGFRAGVYASTNVWKTQLTGSSYDSWVRWVAQYQSLSMTAPEGGSIWQYGKGRVPGISTEVDQNYWIGALGDIKHPSKAVKEAPSATEMGLLSCTCTKCGLTQQRRLRALGRVSERFEDVQEGAWYTDAVQFVIDNGIFSGMATEYFGLGEVMNRAMLVTCLYGLAGKPAATGACPFRDVKSTDYFYDAVRWAYQKGIVSGTGANSYEPYQGVTREQAAQMLYRYFCAISGAEPSVETDLSAFPDQGSVSEYARKAVAWAVENHIISGSPVGDELYLLPAGGAQRAQVAVMLLKYALILRSLGLWKTGS